MIPISPLDAATDRPRGMLVLARAAHGLKRVSIAVLLALACLAPLSARAVTVERVVSPQGVEAWLVRDPTIPILSVHFAFRGGAATDPAGKEGLSRMVSALLDEGAGDLDSEAFQRRLNDLAITLRFDTGPDYFTGRLKTLSENRDQAFELLELALNKPRFDAEPIQRIRSQILAILAHDAEDPDYIAAKTWYAAMFPGHPYARPTDGTPESVRAIGDEDLRDFVHRRLARDNLLIGVVGDITPEVLAPLLDKTFGALPAHADGDGVPEVKPSAEGGTIVIDRDIPQSVVVFGEEGVKRDDPDYYIAYVMNYILGGGGFTSRLTEQVREKRGLAYSVYSYLMPMEHTGLIVGGVATENSRLKESLDLIRAEWRRLADGGVTDEELKNAKSYLTGSFPLRLDSSDEIAETLVSIQMGRLGIDYMDRRNALIEGVTRADIRRVAKRLIAPEALTFVVVGRPTGVTATREVPAGAL
ncbi:MAG: pitrilysin family protein [Alphaproteobacteria bacterium]